MITITPAYLQIDVLHVLQTDIAVHVFGVITIGTAAGRIEARRSVQLTVYEKDGNGRKSTLISECDAQNACM